MPSRATVNFQSGRAVIDIDGQDISHVCRMMSIVAVPGQLPIVTAELVITDLLKADAEQADVTVKLDDATRAALVALGWTPPAPTVSKEGGRRGRSQ